MDTTDQLFLSFINIISSAEKYEDTEYYEVSLIIFSTFWSYVLIMILSFCYHWRNVFEKVRDNKENFNSAGEKTVVLNHHEYCLENSIWSTTSFRSGKLKE